MTRRSGELVTTARWQLVLLSVAANGLVVGAPPMAIAGQCIRDATGFTQPNICNANDVTIASIAVLGTCVGGTQNGATCIVRDNTDPCVLGGGTCPGVTQCVVNQPVSVPMR